MSIDSENSKYSTVIFRICFFWNFILCSMCNVSSCLPSEGNIAKAEAVNVGIVYLMVIPYILVGIIGYAVFRMYRKKKK
jgi:hypothetical protein